MHGRTHETNDFKVLRLRKCMAGVTKPTISRSYGARTLYEDGGRFMDTIYSQE